MLLPRETLCAHPGNSSHRWRFPRPKHLYICSTILLHLHTFSTSKPASHPNRIHFCRLLLFVGSTAKIRRKKGIPEAMINGHRLVRGVTNTLTPKKTPTVTHRRRHRHRQRGGGNAIGMGMRGCPRVGGSAAASPRRDGGGRGAGDRAVKEVEAGGAGWEMTGLMRQVQP